MKKMVVLSLFVVPIFIFGCSLFDTDPDIIEIITVSPSSGLQDRVEYNFSVRVSYTLKSSSAGDITVNFNTDTDNGSFFIRYGDAVQITQGSGEYTFNVFVTGKSRRRLG